jgi:hypothetical protein
MISIDHDEHLVILEMNSPLPVSQHTFVRCQLLVLPRSVILTHETHDPIGFRSQEAQVNEVISASTPERRRKKRKKKNIELQQFLKSDPAHTDV